jgi:hypothetical protein
MLGEHVDAVGILGIVAEVAVRLVEDDQRRIGAESLEELQQRRARMIVVAGLCGEHRITALVRGVTWACTSSRSVS